MNERYQMAAHHLNGYRTAENYVDECVMRDCGESSVLADIVINMAAQCATPEESYRTLTGFCDYLHSLLRAKYGPSQAQEGANT